MEKNKNCRLRAENTLPLQFPNIFQAWINRMSLQVKAAEKGFDWQNHEGVIAKIREELSEVEEVLQDMTNVC